ncbi:hypothetical protein [Kozakia baliensis]|uniref:Uncharacterized protein n=1 Tax=Kozakia baliensis TaxID=153496 RepID=A0A1D8URQ9_9PROT|nr:hypothetical protein [Kozakia baliensis]AOX16197.1 hypothetical protein A0U89_02630 [Kozakia baliensis]GBR28159.1 hypothetical protein AA0488_1330 [Kozakia baliensis NRIC 0488]GEL63768.1 hypothetical protein KBA01_10540 [Kozakia baliensis]
MKKDPAHEAENLIQTQGAEAATFARRQYQTALEMEDIKLQGYWLDVLNRIKASPSGGTTAI